MKFSVETWASDYGVAADENSFEELDGRVDVTIERPADRWAPITPAAAKAPERILFIDGVRRIDARIWIHDGDRSHLGVCASVATGAVTCSPAGADVGDVHVKRGLFATAASGAEKISTRHATYEFRPVTVDDPTTVYASIDSMMTTLELATAAEHDCDLVVFDGPLRGRDDPIGVGYIKTQFVQYLPDDLVGVLGRLDDRDRTPLMLIGQGGYSRYSWYLRLPGPRSQPLSGIVRLELPAIGTVDAAIERAETISASLPRFASERHKEPRSPQNLYPISGLESQLRRRLGDSALIERSLRIAANHATTPTSPAP